MLSCFSIWCTAQTIFHMLNMPGAYSIRRNLTNVTMRVMITCLWTNFLSMWQSIFCSRLKKHREVKDSQGKQAATFSIMYTATNRGSTFPNFRGFSTKKYIVRQKSSIWPTQTTNSWIFFGYRWIFSPKFLYTCPEVQGRQECNTPSSRFGSAHGIVWGSPLN